MKTVERLYREIGAENSPIIEEMIYEKGYIFECKEYIKA